jgi:sodium/bile acid cotransporter 7
MILPLCAGQLFRLCGRSVRIWIDRKGELWKGLINGLILLTVFFAFSRAASSPFFREKFSGLGLTFLYLASVHLILAAGAYYGAVLIGLSRENRIAVLFTAPQKTIVLGVPLITAYFGDRPDLLGLALLPLLFYHSWQLVVAGIVKSFPAIRGV